MADTPNEGYTSLQGGDETNDIESKPVVFGTNTETGAFESRDSSSKYRAVGGAPESKPLMMRPLSLVEKVAFKKKMNQFRRTLLSVALFYLVPSLQIVLTLVNMQGRFIETDPDNKYLNSVMCHYNNKCKKDLGPIPAFNNVSSNVAYLVVGFALMLYFKFAKPKTDKGVFRQSGIYYAVALATILEGVFSGLYHTCPCIVTFQFDSTMMFFIGGLLIICVWHKRHGNFTLASFKFFLTIFVLFALNTLDLVLKASDKAVNGKEKTVRTILRWGTGVLLIFVTVYSCFRTFHGGKLVHGVKDSIEMWWGVEDPADFPAGAVPPVHRTGEFWLKIGLLCVNLAIVTYSLLDKWLIFYMVLGSIMADLLFFCLYYFFMKYLHGEKVPFKIFVMLVLQVFCASCAYYFFSDEESDGWVSLEESAKLNAECVVFGYWDRHDIWHVLSACAIGLTTLILHDIDLPTHEEERGKFAVF